jgi:hypothetical protein
LSGARDGHESHDPFPLLTSENWRCNSRLVNVDWHNMLSPVLWHIPILSFTLSMLVQVVMLRDYSIFHLLFPICKESEVKWWGIRRTNRKSNSRCWLSGEIFVHLRIFWNIELSVRPSNRSLPALPLAFVIFRVTMSQTQQENDIDSFFSERNDVGDQKFRFTQKYGRQGRFSDMCCFSSYRDVLMEFCITLKSRSNISHPNSHRSSDSRVSWRHKRGSTRRVN